MEMVTRYRLRMASPLQALCTLWTELGRLVDGHGGRANATMGCLGLAVRVWKPTVKSTWACCQDTGGTL